MDPRSVPIPGTGTSAVIAAMQAESLQAQATARRETTPPPQLPRASFIERRDGTALFYKDWGSGRPVVFVSSAGLCSDMWAYQMVHLAARGYRCVAFDRRGPGRSSDPGRGYDFDTLADDLGAVIEVLDLRNVTLVGHSMGCAEIARYLTRHGWARITRVAMLAPTLPFLLKTEDHPEGVDRAFFQAMRGAWTRDFPKWVSDNTRPFFVPETSAEMQRWGIDMMLKTSLQAALECNVAVTETDFREELTTIKVPTLILHGTKDVSAPLPLTGEPTAKLIPGSRLVVYDGAPHGLFITHMDQVNGELLAFVES